MPAIPGRLYLDMQDFYKKVVPPAGQPPLKFSLSGVSQHYLGNGIDKEVFSFKQLPRLQNGSDADRQAIAIYCMKVREVRDDVFLAYSILVGQLLAFVVDGEIGSNSELYQTV